MLKIGWFSTGRDEAARDLLRTVHDKITGGEIEADISFVFSNREPGESKESDLFFSLARQFLLPLVNLSSNKYREKFNAGWREKFDGDLISRLKQYPVDVCVLAGYMLIAGEKLCKHYKMINLHPALPGGPTGAWQEVVWQLIREKKTVTGAMIHLVTPELDRGPVVTFCSFPIRGKGLDELWKEMEDVNLDRVVSKEGEENSLFKKIREYELACEFPLIVLTIKAFSEGKVGIRDGEVVDARGMEIKGYDLTEEVEESVKRLRLRC